MQSTAPPSGRQRLAEWMLKMETLQALQRVPGEMLGLAWQL